MLESRWGPACPGCLRTCGRGAVALLVTAERPKRLARRTFCTALDGVPRFYAVACKFGAPPRPLFFTCPYFVVYTRRKRKGGAGAYFKGQGLSVVMMREFSPRTFRTSSVPHGTWRGLHTAHGNLQSVCSGDPVLRAGLISRQLGTVGRPGSAGSLSVRGTDHVYRTLHACVYRVGRFRSQPVDLHRSSGRAHV